MTAKLHPCNETGFDLEGMPGDFLTHLRAYVENGSLRIMASVRFVEGQRERDALQNITPAQARAMARRLFALAAEADLPKNLMDGPGKDPLTTPI